jgi:hypothetical protein
MRVFAWKPLAPEEQVMVRFVERDLRVQAGAVYRQRTPDRRSFQSFFAANETQMIAAFAAP